MDFFDQKPWTIGISMEVALLLGIATLLRKRLLLWGVTGGLLLALRPVPVGVLEVNFWSIGQGDAALVRWPDGRTLLVDGGPPGRALLQELRRLGIRRLDTVLLSHPHPDHMGGLEPILAELPVGLVRSAFFGAMAKHFAIPASELEAALKSRNPQPVRAAPKPATNEPRPDPMEALYAAFVLKDRRLLSKDEHRCFDELKHLGVRTLVAKLQSGSSPEDVQFEASETLKAALQQARDQLKFDDSLLETNFEKVCRKIKLGAIKEQLDRIAKETAHTPGASELTEEARNLLQQRGQLLDLQRRLLSQK